MARSTPSSLLADQLWTGSGCFADWWGRQQRYAGSLAFMSVVRMLVASVTNPTLARSTAAYMTGAVAVYVRLQHAGRISTYWSLQPAATPMHCLSLHHIRSVMCHLRL